ncbi:MAG: HNH endonuclease, partial [Pseudomonadota bacterium]
MIEKILKLDVAGRPTAWITREEGALLYCRDQVAWEAGTSEFVLRGGFNRVTGLRTVLRLNTIVATKTVDKAAADTRPVLTNAQLFA